MRDRIWVKHFRNWDTAAGSTMKRDLSNLPCPCICFEQDTARGFSFGQLRIVKQQDFLLTLHKGLLKVA